MATSLEQDARHEVLSEIDSDRKHFMDIIMAAAAKRAASALARKQMADIPGLSLSSIISNLRILGTRAGGLSELQTLPIEFFSWDRPALTISGLLLFTVICHRPYLLTCIPVFWLLTQVLIPNYDRKFPVDPSLLPSDRPAPSEFGDLTDQDLVLEQAKEKVERDLLLALRRGQNSLAKLVEGLEKFDQFKAGPAGFVDVGVSSSLFVICLVVLVNTAVLTSYVPVTPLIIGGGWAAVILKHPAIQRATKELPPLELKSTLTQEVIAKLKPQFALTEKPLERIVEIYELQKQGLTPRMWDSIEFSPYMYTTDSAWRLSNQLPPGTKFLADVLSPDDWYFDEEDDWVCDKAAVDWVSDREIGHVKTDGEWAYDTDEQWRRRRWVRRCYHRT